MKIEDVEIGMKVVPHKKSIGDAVSVAWNRIKRNGQPFLYVVALPKEKGYHKVQLWDTPEGSRSGGGDSFHAVDFEPYVEPTSDVPPGIAVAQTFCVVDECGVTISRHDTLEEAVWAQACRKFEAEYNDTDGIGGDYRAADAESVRHWILDNEKIVRELLDARARARESKGASE